MKPLLRAFLLFLALTAPALAQDPPAGLETNKIVLYQPEEVLQDRLADADAFAAYIKQVHAVCTAYFAATRTPEALAVVVAVRPGKRARVWFVSSTRPGTDAEREPLRKELEAVPACEVRHGPVVFAISARIAGGDGLEPARGQSTGPPIPDDWLAAAGNATVPVPDGFLDLVWPDPPPPTPVLAKAVRPAVALPAKPTVYIHVFKESDPQDQAARDTYGARYRVVDLKDSPAYVRPKPVAGVLPTIARAATGEALSGHVLVEYVVTVAGSVADPVVLRSADPRLDAVALKAMQAWRFEPARLSGVPISTTAAQEFTFKRP